MSTNEVNPTEASNNEANSSNQIQKAVKSVTKRAERATTEGSTKAKNPKRVEQGKKLAEHNKKMKQQLVKMKLAGEPSEESSFTQTAFENRSLIFGGLGIAGVVVLYLIWKNKSTSSQQISVQPKQEASIPKQEPILDME